jgi:GTP pyrophosphokinase
MVHSDIGNRCVGAKVNGKIVPLKTQLVNGDQVEIITSKHPTVSLSWEKFVVTGKARGEIQKVIQQQLRGQHIKLGKTIIYKALKANKIEDETKAIEAACKFFSKTPDELFFALGEGTITREEVIKLATPKKSRLSSTLSLLKFTKKTSSKVEDENVIPIKGLIPGMAMHYAKCCHPLPGDKIVGIVHTGSGITIHTSDCEMLNNFASMPERILYLTWDNNKSNIPFISRIKVLLLNEPESLAILAGEIAKNGGNITNFKILSRNSNYFELIFDVEVKSLAHIEVIINALRIKEAIQYADRDRN